MNKAYIKKLTDLMRADLITMNGPKNSMKSLAIMTFAFVIIGGICFSPVVGLYGPIMIGCFFVPAIFNSEMKCNAIKMFGIIPIERKDLVRSRFILCSAIFTAVNLVIYLLMLISLKLKLYLHIASQAGDILKLAASRSDGLLNEFGLFNVTYSAAFAIGMIMLGNQLKNYFKDSKMFAIRFNSGMGKKKLTKDEIIAATVVTAAMVLFFLFITGILDMSAALVALILIFFQFAMAGNGVLLTLVFMVFVPFHMAFEYVNTLVNYEKKEI